MRSGCFLAAFFLAPVIAALTLSPPSATSEPQKARSTVQPAEQKSEAHPESAMTSSTERAAEASFEAAPRAAQIEPVMVEPVKRVVPKTPDIKTESTSAAKVDEKRANDSKTSKRREKVKVVGDRPNCDTGFKVDASGKGCVRIAQSSMSKKGKR